MRILHTSDWHLGARLGNQDRLADQLARMEEICAYVDANGVDLLLVAGDVFDEHRADTLAKIIGRLGRILAPRISDGLTCVFIAGNHDREHVFPLLRGLQEFVSPEGERRVLFAERPTLEQITTHRGEKLNLMLLPYPTSARYDLADQRWPSPDTKRNALHDAVRERILEMSREVKSIGAGARTVVCGHFWIRGVTVGAYRMTEQEDVLLEPAEMPAYDYVALGHIHKAQLLGAPHIRYSGSIERMDRGEQGDEKIALLVEVTRRGLQDVKELPLNATPFAHVAVASEQEMAEAAGRIPDLDRTLVSVTATLRREQSLASMIASARRLFPRLYSSVEVKWSGDEERESPEVRLDRRDVASNVRSYLSQQLGGDPDLEPLTSLAVELLVETGVSEA